MPLSLKKQPSHLLPNALQCIRQVLCDLNANMMPLEGLVHLDCTNANVQHTRQIIYDLNTNCMLVEALTHLECILPLK